MPAWKTLPKDVQYLSRLNGVHLDDGREFERDAVRVVSAIHMMTSPHGATRAGFEMHFRSAEIDYKCRRCGYESSIEKLEWQRDGERPPTKCPQCAGRGYQEGAST